MLKFNKEKMGSQGNFELIPDGDYEVFIESAKFGTASTGTEGVKMTLLIRKDVAGQEFGGRKVWHDIWYTEASEFNLHNLLGAVNTPEDHPGFNDLKEVAAYVEGKAMKVNLGTRKGTGKWAANTYQDVKAMLPSDVGGGRVDSPFATGGASGDPFANASASVGQAPPAQTYAPTYNGQPQGTPPPAMQQRVNDDPFANTKAPIEVSEDDLPF